MKKRTTKPVPVPAATIPPAPVDTAAFEAANRKTQNAIVRRCNNAAHQIGEDGERSTPCPCEAGLAYPVTQVSFSNIHGGTELADVAAVVTVVARWWDYETGWHFAGEVQSLVGPAISGFSREPIALPVCVRFGQFDLRK